jgi:hypothetical protein
MSEVGAITKDKTNTQQGFKYRGIDDVMNALQPLLVKHKVFIVPEVLEQIREDRTSSKGNSLIYSVCKIKYTFFAEDGSNVTAIVIGEGMDSGDKATNKAMAIAMKYACFQIFCIPTEEMVDPDKETHNLKGQPELPKEKIYHCEDCGYEVTDTAKKTIAEIIEGSQKYYKKNLCQKCVSKRYKASQEAK